MAAIDAVLSRMPDARKTGPDRWRSACPVCGEGNRSTLSIGVTNAGAVLVKCFKSGCGVGQIAAAIGLELAALFPARDSWAPPLKRRRMLSATQALDVIAFESMLTWTAAHNLAAGYTLTPDDLQRLAAAAERIQALAVEVHA